MTEGESKGSSFVSDINQGKEEDCANYFGKIPECEDEGSISPSSFCVCSFFLVDELVPVFLVLLKEVRMLC